MKFTILITLVIANLFLGCIPGGYLFFRKLPEHTKINTTVANLPVLSYIVQKDSLYVEHRFVFLEASKKSIYLEEIQTNLSNKKVMNKKKKELIVSNKPISINETYQIIVYQIKKDVIKYQIIK